MGTHPRNCSLCREFAGDRTTTNFAKLCGHLGFSNREILKTEHLILIPTHGGLMEGHLLLCSRSHTLSFRNFFLGHQVAEEFDAVLVKACAILDDAYHQPITIFEHGPARAGSPLGCGTDHAHLHLLPVDLALPEDVRNDARVEWVMLRSWHELTTVRSGPVGYLLWHNKGEIWLGRVLRPLPSQYLRRAVASALGAAAEWDWHESPKVDRIESTLTRCRSCSTDELV